MLNVRRAFFLKEVNNVIIDIHAKHIYEKEKRTYRECIKLIDTSKKILQQQFLTEFCFG